MRGDERVQNGMFSYVSLKRRAPQDRPVRAERKLTETVLRPLSAEFDALYAGSGRPSVAAERILRSEAAQGLFAAVNKQNRSNGAGPASSPWVPTRPTTARILCQPRGN